MASRDVPTAWRRCIEDVANCCRFGWEAVMDVVFPLECGACAVPLWGGGDPVEGVLCPDCAEGLEKLEPPLCPRCASPLPERATLEPFAVPSARWPQDQGEGHGSEPSRCHACRRLEPVFDSTLAGWQYGGSLLEAVHALKYDRKPHLSVPLARLLAAGLGPLPPVDLVVPVPTHRLRLRQRGFDHTSCLAAEVARVLGVPFFHGALKRHRHDPPQVCRNLEQRLAGVKGSISIGRGGSRMVSGRRVLLVDDVMTSGATANASAEALKSAGAATVTVGVLARAC